MKKNREKKIQCTVHLKHDFFVVNVVVVVSVIVVAAFAALLRIKFISLCRIHGSFVRLFVKFSQNLAHFFFIYFVSLHKHTTTTKKLKKKKN